MHRRLGYRRLADFLRATQDPEYLSAKAVDIGDFSRLAILLAAVFLVAAIIWDYAIDPANALGTAWLRIVESLAVLGWAMANRRGIHSKTARIAALVTPLFVEITFLQILSMLHNGSAYGMGGILYGYIFGPFLVLAQPFGFAVLVLALPAILPVLAWFLGLSFGVDWGIYNAYVWMGFVPVVFILLFFEYLYWNVFSYRRQVEKQAVTDGLTQIANRRHFLGEGARHLARHHRNRDPASLLFIDVDRFKSINDSYGHHVGDDAIKHVVDTLLPLVRESDLIARYGGEEFVVFLQETGARGADLIAERMRAAVVAHPFVAEFEHAPTIKLTVSIGVSVFEPGATPDIDLLIHDADQALYEAKRRGRDCVVGYGAIAPDDRQPHRAVATT
ncbi:GGDEF domain-containing protein [Salinisphaera aquimarina]|uniref:GGDEF domain-containing protein n=1 Tax=Salinisphaera aquimarina TaxID=2094031 RepID=UPI0036D3266C